MSGREAPSYILSFSLLNSYSVIEALLPCAIDRAGSKQLVGLIPWKPIPVPEAVPLNSHKQVRSEADLACNATFTLTACVLCGVRPPRPALLKLTSPRTRMMGCSGCDGQADTCYTRHGDEMLVYTRFQCQATHSGRWQMSMNGMLIIHKLDERNTTGP